MAGASECSPEFGEEETEEGAEGWETAADYTDCLLEVAPESYGSLVVCLQSASERVEYGK